MAAAVVFSALLLSNININTCVHGDPDSFLANSTARDDAKESSTSDFHGNLVVTEEMVDFETIRKDYEFYDKLDPSVLEFPDAKRNPNFRHQPSLPIIRDGLYDGIERDTEKLHRERDTQRDKWTTKYCPCELERVRNCIEQLKNAIPNIKAAVLVLGKRAPENKTKIPKYDFQRKTSHKQCDNEVCSEMKKYITEKVDLLPSEQTNLENTSVNTVFSISTDMNSESSSVDGKATKEHNLYSWESSSANEEHCKTSAEVHTQETGEVIENERQIEEEREKLETHVVSTTEPPPHAEDKSLTEEVRPKTEEVAHEPPCQWVAESAIDAWAKEYDAAKDDGKNHTANVTEIVNADVQNLPTAGETTEKNVTDESPADDSFIEEPDYKNVSKGIYADHLLLSQEGFESNETEHPSFNGTDLVRFDSENVTEELPADDFSIEEPDYKNVFKGIYADKLLLPQEGFESNETEHPSFNGTDLVRFDLENVTDELSANHSTTEEPDYTNIAKEIYADNLLLSQERFESNETEDSSLNETDLVLAQKVVVPLPLKMQAAPTVAHKQKSSREGSRPSGGRPSLKKRPSSKRTVTVSSSTRKVSVPSGKRKVSPPSGKRKVTGSSNTRKVSVPSGKRKVSASSSKRTVTVSSSTLKVSVPSGKRKVSAPSSTRKVSVPSGKRKVSAPSGKRKVTASSGKQQLAAPCSKRKVNAEAARKRTAAGGEVKRRKSSPSSKRTNPRNPSITRRVRPSRGSSR